MKLPYYKNIKDKYCIYYPGHDFNILTQLDQLRPEIESKYPGINIYLCGRKEAIKQLNSTNTLIKEELNYSDFGYVYDISVNLSNPLSNIIKELNI